jgi:hypothetical protein
MFFDGFMVGVVIGFFVGVPVGALYAYLEKTKSAP